jgi:hypothetical protein
MEKQEWQPASSDIVILDLPSNQGSEHEIVFAGDPPKVVGGGYVLATAGSTPVMGYFFSSLRLPGLEISCIDDPNYLQQLLHANQSVARQLILTAARPFPSSGTGTLYRHDLMTGTAQDLGITFFGFPPVVKAVEKNSPFFGKMHPGQTVDALCLQGHLDLTLQSGGFTASRIHQLLQETSHYDCPGSRQIVVKDRPDVLEKDPNGTRGAFDFDGLIHVGNWFRPRNKPVSRTTAHTTTAASASYYPQR